MLFSEISIAGAWLLELERRNDTRGYFARTWCRDELRQRGLEDGIAQINTGFSARSGTLRGMHFQCEPHSEVKIVRCTRGLAFDVLIDLRPDSPTYRCWQGFELSPDNGLAVYIPRGCAHGYLTLVDDTELMYSTSNRYMPDAAAGVRYDDKAFAVDWPAPVKIVSDVDLSWADFRP
jgi:dTDP-4-dehydrorhamnose 3,5-epimerase